MNQSVFTCALTLLCLSLTRIQNSVEALEWVRTSDPDRAPNLICVYLSPKYDVPDNATGNTIGKKRPHSGKHSTRIMVNAPKKPEQETEDDASIPAPTGMPNPTFIRYLTFSQKLNWVLSTIPARYMTMAAHYLCITLQNSSNET